MPLWVGPGVTGPLVDHGEINLWEVLVLLVTYLLGVLLEVPLGTNPWEVLLVDPWVIALWEDP